MGAPTVTDALPALSWFIVVGAILVLAGFAARWIDRLPMSPALGYLLAGAVIGPLGLDMLRIDVARQSRALELLTEAAVLISLFGVGLRLKLAPRSRAWRVPLLLAGPGMLFTTLLAALAAHWLLGLPAAAALLLAAVLSPTDPVLASDVQLHHSGDRDSVRLSLSAEGGLNDGAAFPLVLLALGLLGAHPLGTLWWRWWTVDVLWAGAVGGLLGWGCGMAMGRVLALLRRTGSGPQSEEFLVLGMIALTYGIALGCKGLGFVAVFAAAVALAHAEGQPHAGAAPAADDVTRAQQLLRFALQCERLMEVVVVLVVGAALAYVQWQWPLLAYAAAMLLIVRPAVVLLLLPKRLMGASQRRLVAWFGIRGVGSVYYLSFALQHGAPALPLLIDATLVTIAASIVAHGISATPLMGWYRRRQTQRPPRG
jgi:NhaP-type Na+/H+ or K+/H+ antiporter